MVLKSLQIVNYSGMNSFYSLQDLTGKKNEPMVHRFVVLLYSPPPPKKTPIVILKAAFLCCFLSPAHMASTKVQLEAMFYI